MKINKGFILFFICLFSVLHVFCTTNSIDSLRIALKNAKGNEKISLQLDLAHLIYDTDAPVADSLTKDALKTAVLTNNKEAEMRAYLNQGMINYFLGKTDTALTYFDKALLLSNEIGESWYKGEILFRQGSINFNTGQDLIALELFNKSLQACRESNNFRIMGAAYSMMGTIFRLSGLYLQAIDYIVNSKINYTKAGYKEGDAWSAYLLGRIYSDIKKPKIALDYFMEALNLYSGMAAIDENYTGVAICYEQIGILNMESGELPEAKKNFELVLDIYNKANSENGISSAHKYLGQVEYLLGDYKKAEYFLNSALEYKTQIGEMLSIPGIYEFLGLCEIKKGNIEKGFKTIFKGLELARSNNQIKLQRDIYAVLAETYLKQNDLKNALYYQSKQIDIQDSILSGTANIKIESLQGYYELEAKNKLIQELESQNAFIASRIKLQRTYQFITIAGLLLALFGTFVVYWFYREIRNKNQKLREANASKDKLLTIISHDLRGPVGTVTTFLGQLTSQFDQFSPEELKGILINLEKSSENASNLLENLLAWARSQADKIDFIPAKLNLTELLANTLESIKHVADNKDIQIHIESDDQINVFADPDMLKTIFRNLVSNAIKFTHRGKSVTIKTETNNPNNALICIIDEGVGIEKEAIENIFDINNSHHTPGTEDEKSSGLGLILVKDFVERNKGTLNIESEPGKGTVVSFTLPLAT